MKIRGLTTILNVSDVPASIAWFEKLGWQRAFTWNDGGMIQHAGLSNATGKATFAGICAPNAAGKVEEHGHEGGMMFLCTDGQGSRDPRPYVAAMDEQCGGVWMSWFVVDADEAHAECVKHGVEIARPIANMPWGVREFLIRHPDGHYFRISGPVKDRV